MTERCIHRWRIATPTGPTSRGVCLRCGAEREFVNGRDDPFNPSTLAPSELSWIPRGHAGRAARGAEHRNRWVRRD